MRAYVLRAPGVGGVEEVAAPSPAPDEVVIEVERVGVCGTDMEFYSGEMPYLADGHSTYPIRLGHEWCGRVVEVGPGVSGSWVGRRVVGDTMLGCGDCECCARGRQHVCGRRNEVGVRDGRPGALAEQLAMPVHGLHPIPDTMDPALGALVEPAGNALRAARATLAARGDRVLVIGPGTIGLLVAMFVRAAGADVHVLGVTAESLEFSRSLGFEDTFLPDRLPNGRFHAVVDASNAEEAPQLALDVVEPAGRVVYIGLAGAPSTIDTRSLALNDVTAVGVLSASPALSDAIHELAVRNIDPQPLVGATVGLEDVSDVLAGRRPAHATAGPKIQIEPRRLRG